MMCRLAVLISNKGTGTNFQAIIDGVESGKIQADLVAVIADTSEALGLERARKHKLPVKIVPEKEELLEVLKKLNVGYICLAGWKQIIVSEVIDTFPDKILNLHPGLIPDSLEGIVRNPDKSLGLWNKGKLADLAIQNFLDNKSSYAGSSVHFLTHEFDFGPVLGRCFEKIRKGDTVESLYKRLKVKENKLYVEVLAKLTRSVILSAPPRSGKYPWGEAKDLKTILIIDGGGRGAALVDKYAQSPKVGKILAVPGNDLMQINTQKQVITYPHLKTTSVKEIIEICQKEKVDLVDVAQDNAVAVGLVDELLKKKITVVGPTKKAGQIEWDKAWARKFMQKYQVPNPKYQIFKSEKAGIEFAKKNPNNKWFVKAAGLAEGKGVIPAANLDETTAAIKEMERFGLAGKTYLLEEWLMGEEFSAFAVCDGDNFQIVGYAQDHKRVNDGDKGPNTGGMGCVSNPMVISKIKDQISKIFKKTINGLKKENRFYEGVLYLGGIVVDGKVFIIEFNARWGDPEAEVILPSIQTDYLDIAEKVVQTKLDKLKIKVDTKIRISIAGAAKGYPGDYSKVRDKQILGLDKAIKQEGITIYGAGIKKSNNKYLVNGGRIFHLVAEGKDILEAREKAYQAMRLINIKGDNLHYRKDIGWRDIERVKS
ncbi:phosphoribosylamine--glycine ligase [Candidatus Daviesbacteria bacterium]|nr:phosphoribosylamine--glycine ligase [Candidatus Daviesbacteria bacterium]